MTIISSLYKANRQFLTLNNVVQLNVQIKLLAEIS